jgi:hypothetical protein
MEMDIETTDHEDVAEPGQVVSGTAGTGQEHGIQTGSAGTTETKNPHSRVVIGLGVLYNGKILPPLRDAAHGPVATREGAESTGDLVFSLFDRDDRIRDRLEKKIARLDRRIAKLEDRRRSP